MANQEEVDLLKQSVEQWNKWRKRNQAQFDPMDVNLNLSHVDLSHADLSNLNLSEAILSKADLSNTILDDVDLSDSDLSEADLSRAQVSRSLLRQTNLNRANLIETALMLTDMIGTDLSWANLSNAYLATVNLTAVNLSHANLSGAKLRGATIAEVDLRSVKGLAEIMHEQPSVVQLHTVQFPQDGSALHFLRGTGIPDEYIDIWRTTMMHPVQYHSLFISYSSKDETFARRLHADLQAKGIRCWFAPEDLKTGTKFRQRIDEAIHLQDKLLLLLSEHSIASAWVENEVEAALEKEDRQQREVLFPVRLDESVMYTSQAWAAKLRRTYHIGDFTTWTNPQAYQQAFERLLRDLKAENRKEDTHGEPGTP